MSEARLEDFRLLRRLGEGAAGEVWLATPNRALGFANPGDPLAVKVYKEAILKERGQSLRLDREYTVGTGVAHPNVVRTLARSSGSEGSPPFLVMKYVDGVPLSSWISMFQPVPATAILRLFTQIVDGVSALHHDGVIHRDLKPANIMVTPTHDALVMDLGVVRITAPTNAETDQTPGDQFLGTIRNSSPEMLFGRDYDHRTDLYSLGTILYAMLQGEEVFSDERYWPRLIECVKERVPTLDFGLHSDPVGNALAGVAEILLHKDPANRTPDCETLLFDLASVPAGRGEFEPLHAYVATALTGLDPEAAEAIAFLSARIADVAKAYDLYVYQPRRATDPLQHPDIEPSIVYATDRGRVAGADVLFVVLNQPSFGVGQEIEIAASYGKPVILLHRQGVRVSRMVLGSFVNIIDTIAYETPEDLERQLRGVLSSNIADIRRWVRALRVPVRFRIGQQVAQLRKQLRYSAAADVAKTLHLSPALVEALERGEYENVGVELLGHMADGLGVTVRDLVSGSDTGRALARGSDDDPNLRRLEEFARRMNIGASEFLDLRDEYVQEVAAMGSASEVTDAGWGTRHTKYDERKLRDSGWDERGGTRPML